jgi:hypothetical protein
MTQLPVRVFAEDSGRMHAASVVVRCPLTPCGSDPRDHRERAPTALDGITPNVAGP